MSVAIYFAPRSLTTAQYDDVIKRLDAAGASAPAGRSFHCSFSAGPSLHIFEVWESPQAFEAFGSTLMPILAEVGVDPGRPLVTPVHDVTVG